MSKAPFTSPRLSPEDIRGLEFEIGQAFTPSTPIKLADLFAGRQRQMSQLISAVAEPGRHAILYGERGVGKTSLSQVLEFIVPAGRQNVVHSRKSCTPNDNFESIWRKFFKDMRFSFRENGEEKIGTVNEVYSGSIEPDDVLREMKNFLATDIPIFVIDEFNEIDDDGRTASLLANT